MRIAFAGVQLFWSNYIDGTLVNVIGGMFTLLLCAVFFRFWQPKPIWRYPEDPPVASWPGAGTRRGSAARLVAVHAAGRVRRRVGLPPVKHLLESTDYKTPVPGLHQMVLRTPPVVAKNHAEPAIMELAWLSTIGTGTFLAGLLAGPILGLSFGRTLRFSAGPTGGCGTACWRSRP